MVWRLELPTSAEAEFKTDLLFRAAVRVPTAARRLPLFAYSHFQLTALASSMHCTGTRCRVFRVRCKFYFLRPTYNYVLLFARLQLIRVPQTF